MQSEISEIANRIRELREVCDYSAAQLAKELGLPENEEILMIMDLGHAAPGAGPLPNHGSRKPLADTVAYL